VKWRVLIAALVLLVGCAADGATPRAAAPRPAASRSGWESVETVADDGTILVEKVSYRSAGLRIYGQLCRPKRPGRYRVVVWNHGGFEGLTGADDQECRDTARMGLVQLQSSYRGEGGSQGHVEVCLGEVNDVLAMMRVGLRQPYADADHVFMVGASHGGCITVRAIEGGAKLDGAVDISGPTDWATDFKAWRAQQDAPRTSAAAKQFFRHLMNVLVDATGGTPDAVPDEYRKRSPLFFAGKLAHDPKPFLVVHGNADVIVPPSDSCRLVATVTGFRAYHVGAKARVSRLPPRRSCGLPGVTWLKTPKPTIRWPADRFFVVYDGVGHVDDPRLLADVRPFLLSTFR
jgi:dienelactone hydrolase